MANMIETKDLTKKFGDFTANDRINLQVKEGEIKCIVGENGAGKTTLMNMLYGLLQPTSGEIWIKGQKTVLKSPLEAIAAGIGMVHQHFKLVPSLTVYENILLGSEITKTKGKFRLPLIDRQAEIDNVYRLMEKYRFSLDPMERVEDISVGSRQRIEILKMLYRNVDILILDEPTAVLTPQEADQLIVTLKELQAKGKTIIIITHKLREVMELADSVTVIKQGRVVGDVRKQDTSEKQLAQMMVGRDVVLRVENQSKSQASDEIRYEVKDLATVNDQGKEVVAGISFYARQGEILGIAGVEGNGQSELVKLMTGLMCSTRGRISMNGKDVTNWWPEQLRSAGMGIIPEDRYAQGLCREMSLSENCIAGYHNRADVCWHGFHRTKEMDRKRDRFIEDFDIRLSNVKGLIGSLSGGNAQKVIIARELSAGPKLLIACQPTRGVDIGSIEFIHKQLLQFKEAGNTVILVSSELSEIMSLSDRVLVMYKGKISGEVQPREVSSAQIGLLMAGITAAEE